MRTVRPPVRTIAVLIAAVFVANLAVLAGVADRDADDGVASAAVAIASSAEPAGSDVDPLAGLDVDVPRRPAVDRSIELPQPEPVPVDAYAPTPEVRHGRIEIPEIGLSQPLFEGVTLTAIDRGPSHWPGSAMPGEVGNVVVAGHRTTYTKPFLALDELVPGDELIFTVDGERTVYVLDRTEIVAPTEIHIIDQTHARTATLFACHPRGSARQRIVGHFSIRETTPVAFVDAVGTAGPIGAL